MVIWEDRQHRFAFHHEGSKGIAPMSERAMRPGEPASPLEMGTLIKRDQQRSVKISSDQRDPAWFRQRLEQLGANRQAGKALLVIAASKGADDLSCSH